MVQGNELRNEAIVPPIEGGDGGDIEESDGGYINL